MNPDLIADCIIAFYESLPRRGKPQSSEWSVLAGIVAVESDSSMEAVCAATGTRCIGKALMRPEGTVLHDSHAETIARRALIHQTFSELLGETEPLITRNEPPTLVFYVSELPCGDASIVPVDESSMLSLSRADGAATGFTNITGAKPIPELPLDLRDDRGVPVHTTGIPRLKSCRSDARPGNISLSLSCSDKLKKWGKLGFQSALLPHNLEISSLVIGQPGLSEAAQNAVQNSLASFDVYFTSHAFSNCRSNARTSSAGHGVVATVGGLREVISGGESLGYKCRLPSQLCKQSLGRMAARLLGRSFNYGEEKEKKNVVRTVMSKRKRLVMSGSSDTGVLWCKVDDFVVSNKD